jgi:serine phosphatase RsbU (regulator of sigma subunit)
MDSTTEIPFTYGGRVAIGRASPGSGSADCARVISRRDGYVIFFVGDVAGHDARARRLAAELDARVSNLAERASPGGLLMALNAAVAATWPPDVFVSAICFLLDPTTGHGTIADAGQLPPVVKGASSCRSLEVDAGPALGLVAEQRYPERDFVIRAGDVLVAVTDGITDPLAKSSDWLGLAALARSLAARSGDPGALCASLLSATRRFGLHDDATVLAVARGLQAGTRDLEAPPQAWPR